MNIGIISHLKYAIREPFAGGLEMHTHRLATALRARGHAVTLFASGGSETPGLVPLCAPTGPNSVISQKIEHRAYGMLMEHLAHGSFDIIHNNSLHYTPLERVTTLKMPMVTTLHTPPFETLAYAAAQVNAQTPNSTHRFVAISRTTQAAWAAVVPVDHIIPNGIDLTRFAYQPHPDRAPYWVWHGRIVPEKGLDVAMTAANLAGATLRFAGPRADPGYFDSVIAPLLSPTITYEGHLDHQALAGLVGGARVCLCTPRWEEPFGLVIAEALACGTPIAGFRRGALPELLDPGCGVLIDGEAPADLAAAARAARHFDRAACRAHAAANWDAERMVDDYESLYESLIEHHTIRRAA